jgi:hypothetical protein
MSQEMITDFVKLDFGDWSAFDYEVDFTDFACSRCGGRVRVATCWLGQNPPTDDDDFLTDADRQNWDLLFACDCGLGVLFCRCRDFSDHQRIPKNEKDWLALTQRMNQLGTRNRRFPLSAFHLGFSASVKLAPILPKNSLKSALIPGAVEPLIPSTPPSSAEAFSLTPFDNPSPRHAGHLAERKRYKMRIYRCETTQIRCRHVAVRPGVSA